MVNARSGSSRECRFTSLQSHERQLLIQKYLQSHERQLLIKKKSICNLMNDCCSLKTPRCQLLGVGCDANFLGWGAMSTWGKAKWLFMGLNCGVLCIYIHIYGLEIRQGPAGHSELPLLAPPSLWYLCDVALLAFRYAYPFFFKRIFFLNFFFLVENK